MKATSLTTEQQSAVEKMRSFLESGVQYKSKDIELHDMESIVSYMVELDTKQQMIALSHFVTQNSFLLTGPAGSGKTYTSEIGVQGFRIHYCAPTDQACGVLRENTKATDVKTMASVLGTARLDKVKNDQGSDAFYLRSIESIEKDVDRGASWPLIFTTNYLLIDEASMIGGDGTLPKTIKIVEDKVKRDVQISNDSYVALLARLADRLKIFNSLPTKFIFLGDYAQTPPVGTEKDADAYLLSALMQSEDRYSRLETVMRTDCEDIKNLLSLYRKEIDRINEEIKSTGEDSMTISTNVAVVPFAQRVNTDSIKYFNNDTPFLEQFALLYKNRPPEHRGNPNYVSIVNFNNEVHQRTTGMVSRIRTLLFGDSTIKYHVNETLLTKSSLVIKDKVTGREQTLRKDSRVFVTACTEGTLSTIVGKLYKVNIKLPRLTLRFFIDGDEYVETIYAASKFFTDTISNIRSGNRYAGGSMHLTEDEAEYFGLRKLEIPYGAWLELQSLVPDFGYAYVVNNFKIQGSSLVYSMVDEYNILSCRAYPKKKLQYMYTALSRGRKGLYIFHPSNPSNSEVILAEKELEETL